MPISRRQFLKTGLAAAAVAIGALVVKLPKQEASGATSKPRPTPSTGRQQFTYRGKQVLIIETTDTIDVMINNIHQHHIAKIFDKGQTLYASHMRPFENFSNPVQLVKTLIDDEEDYELYILD